MARIMGVARIPKVAAAGVLILLFAVAHVCAGQDSASQTDARVAALYSRAKSAEASGDVATAIANYESILRISPRLAPAYNNLGALYLRHGDYEKAADVLQRGLKINPNMPSAHALLGISLYEAGKYDDARGPLEIAVRANPNDENAELILAKDLIDLGQREEGARHLQHLSSAHPENQEVLYLLGQVYMQLSEDALTRLTTIAPDSVYAHEIAGDVMASMKNFTGALVEYKAAVAMAPQQAGTHYKLGDAFWNLSDWDQALEQFQAELKNDPNNCMARWKLADVLLQQRQNPETALADTERAIALCPKLMQARVDRGRALMLLHRDAEAVPELKTAEEATPDEPSIHFLLAQAYRATGKPDEARTEMQVFAKLEQSARAASAERAKEVIENKEPH